VPGIEGAQTIAFHDGRLVTLDGNGRLRSYYVEVATTCEGFVVEMNPARYVAGTGEAPAKMAHIANSGYEAVGITGSGTLVTWEPAKGSHICGSGFEGGDCYALLKRKITGVVDVSESASHLLVVMNNGSVLSGGMNDCGQLGRIEHGSPPGGLSVGVIPRLSGIVAVATGKRSSMALGKDGKVWTWGNLSHPLIGWAGPSAPTADFIYCGRDLSGPAEAADSTPDVVPGLPPIAAISSFYGFDLALDRQGRVWGWGFNDCGQIGDNSSSLGHFQDKPALIDGLPHIAAIAAGARHALYLGVDGSVWGTGDNEFSQLAMPKGLPTNRPICISSTRRAGVDGYYEKPHRIEGFSRAIAIAADDTHSAAIDADGHVWTWGRLP
jgi:alpha-tubulin suppressor-like RCC1 family protein